MSISEAQKLEIDQARTKHDLTLRPSVTSLEAVLYRPYEVLDHGFVRVVDYMGNDDAVVQAARVSYGRGTKKISEDVGLINYLMRHHHTTPFEMCDIKFHVKLPIFVARQWIRHRTASVNEYSARYSVMDKEFYLPDRSNLASQSKTNRQGRDFALDSEQTEKVLDLLKRDAENAYDGYAWMLNDGTDNMVIDEDRAGLARELARMNLSLNFYTQWYWKTNLHNLMNFLSLRVDPHAQYEIRVYAEAMMGILQRWVPLTHDAFVEHRLGSQSFSKTAMRVIRDLIANDVPMSRENYSLSKREWDELMVALGRTAS